MSTASGAKTSPKASAWTPESGRRPLVGEVDEERIDAPTKQALLMLGVITVATLVMWAAGRAACNYHVPGDGLTPRAVSFEERTRNPKGVAIEFSQALSGADFESARRLIQPPAESLVKAEQDCGSCTAEQAARKRILSVADVLSASRDEAIVAVKTTGAPGGPVERVLHLRRNVQEKMPWRVIGGFPGRSNLPKLEGELAGDTPPVMRQPAPVSEQGGPPLSHPPMAP